MHRTTLFAQLAAVVVLLTACNGGTYSNPASPDANTTPWRSFSVDSAGGTFDFPDIGATLTFPEGAVPEGETYDFQVRLFPEGIPLVPGGPVLVRLGTFELVGPDEELLEQVQVVIRIAEPRTPRLTTFGYILNSNNDWDFFQNVPLLDDGIHAVFRITRPGVYGSFEPVPLHVEATVSRQQGPVPLSVSLKAIVTGGYPPYDAVWNFGDKEDPQAGLSVSHFYENPGHYTVTVLVKDSNGNVASDYLNLTAWGIWGAPEFP